MRERAASRRLQRSCDCGGSSAESCACDKKKLQRHATRGERLHEIPPEVDRALSSRGDPIDRDVRASMESRFRHDFSAVRVHTDASAVASADAVRARAYTVGDSIVFGAGAYQPHSDGGRRLLAHELTHVVQQSGAGASLQGSSPISDPSDASEHEADRAADAVMRGAAPPIARSGGSPQLRRTVTTPVAECVSPNASACLIHLHQNEQNAYETGQQLFNSHCVNLVTLGLSQDRCIPTGVHGCTFNPNRIFSTSDVVRANAFSECSCPDAHRNAALTAVESWRNATLQPAIDRCRARSGGGILPVVALHNNSPGALSLASYAPGGGEARSRETDAAALTRGGTTVANPSQLAGPVTGRPLREDTDQFLVVTRPDDFHALRAHFNVALQSRHPVDDASLSVAMREQRYFNIESEHKDAIEWGRPAGRGFDRTGFTRAAPAPDSPLGVNLAQGRDILAHLRVPIRPAALTGGCTGTGGPVPPASQCAATTVPAAAAPMPAITNPPDPLPRGLPANCRTFGGSRDLAAERAVWLNAINTFATTGSVIARAMNLARLVSWIIGTAPPPRIGGRDPAAEPRTQRSCMERAMRAEARHTGTALHLPSSGLFGRMRAPFSGRGGQRGIWESKWFFTIGHPFDRITTAARGMCPTHLAPAATAPANEQWDPTNPSHRACWNPPPNPPLAGSLDNRQRELEILQASSAPGISRHHWGTDFDFGSVQPSDWTGSGTWTDEYSWLQRNARVYGFVQSFTAASGGGGASGYMEEQWHWSYWPIADALVEFVLGHASEVQSALEIAWEPGNATRPAGTPPTIPAQFQFVHRVWLNYVRNVERTPPPF